MYSNGTVDIVCDEFGKRQFPSCVAFTDRTHLVGKNALRPNLVKSNVVYDTKRLIGRKYSDPSVEKDQKVLPFKIIKHKKNWVQLEVAYKNVSMYLFPEQVSALILSKAKEMVDKKYNTNVTEAVITVPACFDNSQRETTKFAAHLAGFKTAVHILNEPTAAAIGYIRKAQLPENVREQYMVFDLGEYICENI